MKNYYKIYQFSYCKNKFKIKYFKIIKFKNKISYKFFLLKIN